MKVTKETINGREYTVIWHFVPKNRSDDNISFWTVRDVEMIFDKNTMLHLATALPPLPRRPKPEDAPLLYRYMAEGFYIRGNTYNDFERERQECCIMPPTYDDEITGAVHSGNPVDVATEE